MNEETVPAHATGFWRHVGAFGPVLFFADGSVLLVQRHSARRKPSNGCSRLYTMLTCNQPADACHDGVIHVCEVARGSIACRNCAPVPAGDVLALARARLLRNLAFAWLTLVLQTWLRARSTCQRGHGFERRASRSAASRQRKNWHQALFESPHRLFSTMPGWHTCLQTVHTSHSFNRAVPQPHVLSRVLVPTLPALPCKGPSGGTN